MRASMRAKAKAVVIVDIAILLAAGATMALIYYFSETRLWELIVPAIGFVTLIFLIVEVVRFVSYMKPEELPEYEETEIPRALVLLDEDNNPVRYWDLMTDTGFVIGRHTDEMDVDIDLSESEYFSFVSAQHATLNYTDTGWFLDDLHSRNSTYILRPEFHEKLAVTPGAPTPVHVGDVIYIADSTKLAVQ